MKDRYGNTLEVGDTALVACLSHKSAHLREAVVREIVTHRGQDSAKVRTEAGGSTQVSSRNIVKLFSGQDQVKKAQDTTR